MNEYDALIIGCGPGGIEAAEILLAAKKSVAIIENGDIGGVCLNQGCIPAKMLLGAVEPGILLNALVKRKLAQGSETLNYASLQKRIALYIGATKTALAKKLQACGATLLIGSGRFLDSNTLEVTAKEGASRHRAKAIIIATGSHSAEYPGLRADHQVVLDPADLMFAQTPPDSLLVVGAGPIGLELASFFAFLNTKITLVEAAPHIAPTEDADLAAYLASSFPAYEIHTGVSAKRIESRDDGARLELANGEVLKAERALLAIGRQANTDGLNSEAANCRLDRKGFIITDDHLQAGDHVYAIGDVNGRALLAHAAIHQGLYVAKHILGEVDTPYSAGVIPSFIASFPGLFRAGLSEQKALALGGSVEISKSALAANPIAHAHAEPGGLIKAVWRNDRLVGIAGAGYELTELVTAAELLVAGQYSGARLDAIMLAHPTLAESLGQAIRAGRERVD